MKYSRVIGEIFSLEITEANFAIVQMNDDAFTVVQLESDEEAFKMIAEFEDESGDAMGTEGAIFTKYADLHQFRP